MTAPYYTGIDAWISFHCRRHAFATAVARASGRDCVFVNPNTSPPEEKSVLLAAVTTVSVSLHPDDPPRFDADRADPSGPVLAYRLARSWGENEFCRGGVEEEGWRTANTMTAEDYRRLAPCAARALRRARDLPGASDRRELWGDLLLTPDPRRPHGGAIYYDSSCHASLLSPSDLLGAWWSALVALGETVDADDRFSRDLCGALWPRTVTSGAAA